MMVDRPVSAALASLVAGGGLDADPRQHAAAVMLDGLVSALTRPRPLLGRRGPVLGAYLVGGVGRGKTMLMDLFFAAVPAQGKRRVHFDGFMDEMHTAIAAHRKNNAGDPVAAAAAPIVKRTRLLCLDEFQVGDIANAMLLGRLFEKLFAGGVVLVATSNTLPDDLYRHGLNRELFVPFIALLKAQTTAVSVDGAVDYRRMKLAGETVYHFGGASEVAPAMDRLWQRLTGGAPEQAEVVASLGRAIAVPRAALGAARFSFAELCEAPLGARDYLRLAQRYETLLIDGIPAFGRANPSATKRFIALVDTLYDRRVKLGASFAAPLEALNANSPVGGELARTLSRLVEMGSDDYLAAAHQRSANEN